MPPRDPHNETRPLPRLERPLTGTNPIPDRPPQMGVVPPGVLAQAQPSMQSHPTPPLGHAVTNPYQSQPVYPQATQMPPVAPQPSAAPQPSVAPLTPPAYGPPARTGTQPPPPPGMRSQQIMTPGNPMQPASPAAPVAPGSSPRMGNTPGTGTIPSMNAANPPYNRSGGGAPRITVQYPQVGGMLKGARGNYTVLSTLGSGEFGAVYECIGPFDQIYALKMVRPSNRPYSQVQAEWAREQSRLFSLRHPNVVYIYDSFEQDHLFYLALERCDHSLKDMLGTPMQEGLVLEITRQLLAAVQFLHDNEVVHDDIHGGNVLITHTDRPTVKISDFGISHELRGMTAVRPNVVHHAIMAPEILATGYTSRQSDLYQVGLLLYWMLVGEPAIQMDVPYQELVKQVAEGAPRVRAEQIGSPFGDLIARMLRRREAFRYASAREVWADFRELPAWKQRNLFPVK